MTARPTDGLAAALMVFLCLSWGITQVAAKVALSEIPPVTQSALRSGIAALVIGIWVLARRQKLFERDGTLLPGLLAGLLFAAEFTLIFGGLQWTSASRAALFIYTAPFFVALGSIWFLPEERLGPMQWIGLGLCFLGVAIALGAPEPSLDPRALMGDLVIIVAGALWAATTLVIKASVLKQASTEKVLLYQLVPTALICGLLGFAIGEKLPDALSGTALASIAYQGIWVNGLTYLIWFWLVARYQAGQLSAFTFLTPVFGVVAGHLILGDEITAAFLLAVVLLGIGLVLVNRPVPKARGMQGAGAAPARSIEETAS